MYASMDRAVMQPKGIVYSNDVNIDSCMRALSEPF